jgi:hypothetical protein
MATELLQSAPLPLTFDEVTPEWLTVALRSRFPGIEVATARPSGERFGTSSSARFDLTFADRGDSPELPDAVYVKGGFTPATRRRTWGVLQQEARFYTELSPDTKLHIPVCFFAGIDEENQQGIVILEDMSDRGVKFGSYLEPPPPSDRIAAALEQLAAHHAAWWQDPRLPAYASWGQVQRDYLRYLVRPKHWDHLLTRDYADGLVAAIPTRELADRALLALWEVLDAQPSTFLHGDPHGWNLFYEADGTPGFADWQCCFVGHYSHDVSWVIASALGIEQRRADERDLLRVYRDALEANGGPAPSFEQLWLLYRQNMAHAFVSGACEPIESDPTEKILNELAERSVAAAADLEVLDALGLARLR